MSRISSIGKKQSGWRISRDSNLSQLENSKVQQSFILPQKFSPAKSPNHNLRFRTSSIEKSSNDKLNTSNSQFISPKKLQSKGSIFQSQNGIPQSVQVNKKSPSKIKKEAKSTLKSKDPNISITQEQVQMIKQAASKDLIKEHEKNCKIIEELKSQFCNFKVLVLKQVTNQKRLMLKMVEDLIQKANIMNPQTEQMIKSLAESEQKLAKEVESKIKNEYQKGIKKFNLQIKLDNSPPSSGKKQINTPNHNNIHQEVKILSSIDQKNINQSPDLQKCSHIVETINVLNEINDTPVEMNPISSPKSINKEVLQNYKSKLFTVTKSHERTKTQLSSLASPTNKGNFKLDTFYNAIEKLKEEVNQIKHISDIKNNKKGLAGKQQ